MGGRGTFATGKDVPYSYETVGFIEGVKVLEPINKQASRRLPEESHSSRAYIKLNQDGRFSQYREYNNNHELIFEIGYHVEPKVFGSNNRKPVLHAHDYSNKDQGRAWHQRARPLTVAEFDKYKKYFYGLSSEEISYQRSKLI